jgi:hypothetical protein
MNLIDIEWLAKIWDSAIPEKFEGTIVDRFNGALRIPSSTRYPVYIAEESPWLLEPLRAMSDPAIRRVDVRGSAGSAKSLIAEMHLAWCIECDAGMYYMVAQSDPDAADWLEDRIAPMLKENEFLNRKMPNDRHKQRVQKIVLPSMSFYCVGANLSNAQSKRVKYLTMDEPHMYRPGIMSAFEKRVEGVRNSKILTLSTGSVLGDESDTAFLSGSCEEWEVPCPHCNQFQRMTDDKDRLRFPRNEQTITESGEWLWSAILPLVTYNCLHCGTDWDASETARRSQALRGRFVRTNLSAPAHHRSFHWEATAIHYFDLGSILMEKIKASRAAKSGSIEPLRDYIQKRRALAWDESPSDDASQVEFERIKGGYLKRDLFDGELGRFLCIDNQAGRASKGEGAHRWYVCRAFGVSESRVIDEGRIVSWEELEELRIQLGVEPIRVLVDIAYDTQAVQEVCVRYGWQGLWGDTTNRRDFPHHELFNGQRVVRKYPFSSVNIGHSGLGKSGQIRQARYYFWCNEPIKNMYHRMRGGMSSYRLTVPQDVSNEYQQQTSVEFKRQEVDKAGNKRWRWKVAHKKANHLLDCDQMTIVGALLDPRLRGILLSGESLSEATTEPPPLDGVEDSG